MRTVGPAIAWALRDAQTGAPEWRESIRAAAATCALVAAQASRSKGRGRLQVLRTIEEGLREASALDYAAAVPLLQKSRDRWLESVMGS
jgi:hypothetical protein